MVVINCKHSKNWGIIMKADSKTLSIIEWGLFAALFGACCKSLELLQTCITGVRTGIAM